MPRHVMEEHRVARFAAVGAAGAVVVGATFGVTGGTMADKGDNRSVATDPAANTVDALYDDRSEQVSSRGMARATLPALVTQPPQPRAQLPQVQEVQPEGSTGAPLPPVPADCEEYSGNRQIGCTLLSEFGFGLDQMPALEALWDKESGWNERAYNESSGAYGIPQALPGNKMASVAGDWETNPATQIRWGLGYIKDRYGTVDAAWAHSQANGWY